MEAEGAQAPRRRRKTNHLDLGSPEPKPHLYPTRERAERITPSPQTDGFFGDEGYSDPPRPKTSTVRLGSSPTGSTARAAQPAPTTSIPRRQQVAPTRQLQPRPTRNFAPPAETNTKNQSLFVRLKHMHWLFLVGLGMIAALVLWLIGSAVLAWGTQRYYDFHYGNPRTYQVDMAVGHGGDAPVHPSHFIAMNLNNRAVVIELKAGNPAQIVSYEAPITILDSGQSPVTLSFKDVNGDQKVDMIIDIHLPGQDQYSIFINDGSKFRPATSNDVIHP